MPNPIRTLLPAILFAFLVGCGGSDGPDPGVDDAEPPVSQEQPPESDSPLPEADDQPSDPGDDSQDPGPDDEAVEEIGFSEPNSIVRLEIDTLGAELPELKGKEYDIDTEMTLTVNGDEQLKTWGRIGVQGSSTAAWPKKNWQLSFFADEERTEEISFYIGDSVVSDKWVAKAEWIDPTMLRNAISYRLWEDIVQSRDTKPMYEVDHAFDLTQPDDDYVYGQGFPKSYPMQINVNGEFYGLAILIMGHDPNNFNIDKDNPKHIYMEFDGRPDDPCDDTNEPDYFCKATWEKFRANKDGVDALGLWIDSYYPKNKDIAKKQREAIDDLGNFINRDITNDSPDNLAKEFEVHLDKTNMIDMFLFMEVIYDNDAVVNDVEIVTYDLKKWYFLPWDKDTTFALAYDNTGFLDAPELLGSKTPTSRKALFDYGLEQPDQKLWYKTHKAFGEDIKIRYAELRRKEVLSVENLKNIIDNVDGMFSEEDRKAEEQRWIPGNDPKTQRKSMEDINSGQIVEWFKIRLDFLDIHFEYIDS